ncbi:EAL domain-containing protein [Pseudomonas sp. NPDC007930]|uniref:bifunctional diguanylate cyclase/phosphodiesterase n=1 Tax=Pseudomonas sp. NPDC007930 TaxID=3364417 RepID=UPI0036ED646F
MSTPPSASLRRKPSTQGSFRLSSLRTALALLVLTLIGLLFWQLFDQYQRSERGERDAAVSYNTSLADHLGMNLALFAQTTLSRLATASPDPAALTQPDALQKLRKTLPALDSVSWLGANGQWVGHPTIGQDYLNDLLVRSAEQAFHYTDSDGGRRLQLLLRDPAQPSRGHWLLTFNHTLLGSLSQAVEPAREQDWLLENAATGLVLYRDDRLPEGNEQLASQERERSVVLVPLASSDWQLRGLFDAAGTRQALAKGMLGKLLLGALCAVLPLLVLLDIRRRQRALQAGRRRYQDIFEGAGVGLCVLNLGELRKLLADSSVHTAAELAPWLARYPEQQAALSRALQVHEVNQVALQVLGVSEGDPLWARLFSLSPLDETGITYQLLKLVLEGEQTVELETPLPGSEAGTQYLWVLMRLSAEADQVVLSLDDITQRKQAELSLVEREAFWAEVIQAVPDHLYVANVLTRQLLYSNEHLGLTLGYSEAEIRRLGESYWETMLHPEDLAHAQVLRQHQRDTAYASPLHTQLRFRHKDGSLRRFDIREQTLSTDAEGRVTRIIGLAKDVSDQLEASQSLRESERRYRLLAESISDVIFSTDSRLALNYVSPSVSTVLGYDVDSVFEQGWQSIIANPAQLQSLQQLLERVDRALGNPLALAELRHKVSTQFFLFDCLRADGRRIPIELRLVLIWDENDNFEGILGVGRDVSQQRRAEKDLRMAATVFEHSTSAILITDPAGYIVQVNEAFTRVSGYSAGQVEDQLPKLLTVQEAQQAHLQYVVKQLGERGSYEGEIWLKRRNGEHYPAWVGITAVFDDEGDLASYVCFFSDISERKASEQRIHRLAYYDALTHLPNRTLFQDRLHNALQQAERQKAWVVLMFLDLDRFKPINDSLGHAAGDRMLKDMATRLLACVDEDDTVARMGGDEFTLLLQPRASREQALNRAIHVAEQILGSLVRPFVLEGREFFVTASIGIALSPQDGNELSQLMKNADTAMYHAKERGKNNFQFYQTDMNASALERLELESDLRHALEQQEFILYYQPQFSGDGKRLTGAEALLRWNHPRRGLVPPGDFIPVLEELGLVVDVGEWVLLEACRQLKAWHQARVRVPKVSVNISARQFSDGQLGTRIAAILEETALPPACLELELTESILMREVNEAMQILDSLKRLGLSIAVDDFGTGYSSLNYLKQFPIDVLKIDRSFVDGLPDGEQDAQIARAIVAMAHSLNLAVIAEGVETHDQLGFLREHGCDEVQGYLFGRPMPASRFAAQFSNDALFMLD